MNKVLIVEKIKYLVFDVDGTLTDGKVYIGNSGELFKAFNIKDGYGISNILPLNNIIPVIITGRKSEIVTYRAKELKIDMIYQGVSEKYVTLTSFAKDLSQVAYMGDDLNDMECMKKVHEAGGIVGCPEDAISEVVNISDFVSSKRGGEGAAREFIEWIIENK